MKSRGSISLQQRTAGRTVLGWLATISILHLNQLAIAFQDQLAVEDAADVGHARWFSILPQLTPNCGGERSQLLGGIVQNLDGHLVAVDGHLIDQSSERSDPRAWEFPRVEEVQRSVGVRCAGRLEQRFAQRRRRAPAFLEAERGAQSLARDVESAAFIAENITPAPGAPRFASTIAAEGERACSGD